MKKRTVLKLVSAVLSMTLLAGCADLSAYLPAVTEGTQTAATSEEADPAAAQTGAPEVPEAGNTEVRIGSLKGPTTIGLVSLMHAAADTATADGQNTYTFTMETQADALLPKLISGDLDIALIPANAASVLYHKTEGKISVIDINTLGVLYMVSGDASIQSVADLSGKTIYTTGKGTTPEYVLNYILAGNNVTDANIEFLSEATEVAVKLSEDPTAIGMLPQPFATVAQKQNEALSVVLDMTAEWDKLDSTSTLVTGVTVARNDFITEHPEAVALFLNDHAASAAFTTEDVETTAEYVVEQGIIEKAPIAAAAIPYCNIVCITGEEMKADLAGYLNVLFEQDSSSVGGALPGDDFYFSQTAD